MDNVKDITKEFGEEIGAVCERLDADLDKVFYGEDRMNRVDGDTIAVYRIWANESLDRVKDVVFSELKNTPTDAGFEMFRWSVEVFSLFDKEGMAYIIIDTWTQNNV